MDGGSTSCVDGSSASCVDGGSTSCVDGVIISCVDGGSSEQVVLMVVALNKLCGWW